MSDLFKSWTELDETALVAITDNGGETADRYTAVFRDGDILGFGPSPGHPLGISQWCGENGSADDVEEWLAKGETLVEDPPDWMRAHLLARMNEAYRDHILRESAKGRAVDDIREELFAESFPRPRYEAADAPSPA